MDDKKCEGWSNYATWRVNLEILSDHDFVQQVLEGGALPIVEDLEEIVENCVFDNLAERNGLAVDYARAFLANVNYHEILEHIIDEIEMNDDYQKMIENYE